MSARVKRERTTEELLRIAATAEPIGGGRYRMPSSDGSKTYIVSADFCSCADWVNRKAQSGGTCYHQDALAVCPPPRPAPKPTAKTRRRPEYTKRTLGANAPTFRISLAVLQAFAKPKRIDPTVCSVPAGCDSPVSGALASGEFRCFAHLVSAQRLGYAVVFCSWCDRNSRPPNGTHGICEYHLAQSVRDYETKTGRKLEQGAAV